MGGGGVAGGQETAFGASGLFNSVMLGQTALWRDGPRQEQPSLQREGSLKDDPFDVDPAEAIWIPAYQPRTRRVWATGFGGVPAEGAPATAYRV